MGQPGRQYSAGTGYRYGFNGKENDNEVKGDGNQQDYGMRIYDTRLGRFLSVDPLNSKFPFYTPYQFASNIPIAAIDLDGMESRISLSYKQIHNTQPQTILQQANFVYKMQSAILDHVHKTILIKAEDLKSKESPLPPWLKNGSLTTSEYDQIIKETISEFLKFSEINYTLDIKEFKINDVIYADIDYKKISLLTNLRSSEKLKDFVVDAATTYEFYSDITKDKGVLSSMAKTVGVVNDIVSDNGNELMKTAITTVTEHLDKLSVIWITPSFASKLSGTLGWIFTPIEAPSGGNPQEIKQENVKRAITSTISAMLFYFINENKINVKKIRIDDGIKVDNTRVKHDYEE